MTDRKLPRLINLDDLSDSDLPRTTEALHRIHESERPLLEFTSGLGEMLRSMQPALGSVMGAISRAGQSPQLSRVTETFTAIGEALAKEPTRLRERLQLLVHRGWFIDPEMPITLVRELALAFECGELEAAEETLVDYYRSNAEAILERVCHENPHRANLVRQCLYAHQAGLYGLSVPTLLIQADGVASDHRDGRQLFSKVDSRSIEKVARNAEEGSAEWIFLSVYAEDSPFSKSTKTLSDDFVGLNRHGVLHGLHVNYSTEINSLRAVSALGYASFALKPSASPAA